MVCFDAWVPISVDRAQRNMAWIVSHIRLCWLVPIRYSELRICSLLFYPSLIVRASHFTTKPNCRTGAKINTILILYLIRTVKKPMSNLNSLCYAN